MEFQLWPCILGRRGGASAVVDVGIDRMIIKWLEIGQWIVVIFILVQDEWEQNSLRVK